MKKINNNKKIKFFFLFFIILSTIFIHLWAIDKSIEGREVIWEPDDNYHEIVKAKNLDSCYKNCEAINNLSKYNIESLDKNQRKLLDIFLHHTTLEYHYIKSRILISLNNFIKNWEISHILLSKIVSVLLIVVFAIFIFVHFNLNICLISSIIILPYVTIKYGFHFSNASDELASVFGIISLIYLYKLKLKNYLISLFFSGIAIFTHPIGVFMIIFNSAFIFAKKKFLIDKSFVKYLLLGVSVIIFYLNLDLNYTNKNINFLNIYNEDLVILDLIKENFKFNSYFLYDVFNLFNFIIIFILLFSLFGNYKIILEKYSSLIPLFFSFFVTILISFFHYAPEASIITRMQQLLTLSLLSFYSVLTYEFYLKIKNYKSKNIYFGIILIVFCVHSYYNYSNLLLKIKSNQESLNLNFNSIDKLKIKKNNSYIIFQRNNSDLSVFKSIFYRFLIEDFNEKNVYVAELINEKKREKILNENFYLIIPSPIINNNLIYKQKRPNCFQIKSVYSCIKRGWYGENRANMSDLLVRNDDLIEINSKKQLNKLLININTYGNEILLQDLVTKNEILLNTKENFEWIELESEDSSFSKIKFMLPKKKFVKINGIKISEKSEYYWPWYHDIFISHISKKNKRSFDFNIKNMLNNYYCDNFNIIDDKSSFVLVEIKCKK